ncbi:MAG: type II toxin-antitoxin system Phd/YefM family antitoxin [Oscillospiraceae bacterium]|nr:type II toxin-antitoxin system Phd/YefM family antitoxin [Oscillospiraceae bacterium]
MPVIRPSADLRNNYNEISEFCHENAEPVFITRNGKGDLAVMSMELFDYLKSRLELHALIEEGIVADRNGKVIPFKEGLEMIRKEINK